VRRTWLIADPPHHRVPRTVTAGNLRALQLIAAPAASPARGVRVTLRVRESGSRRRALAATRDSDGREHGRHAGG
jgi:hypothetical protein